MTRTNIKILFWVVLGLVIVGLLAYGMGSGFGGRGRNYSTSTEVYITANRDDRGTSFMSSDGVCLDATVPMSGISELNLNFSMGEINIYHSENQDFRITQYGRNIPESQILTVNTVGSSIRVRPEGGFNWFDFNGVNIQNNIDVYIPASYNGDLKIDISAGKLISQDGYNLSDLQLNVSAGSIEIEGWINARSAVTQISAGSVVFEKLEAGTFHFEASAGNIKVEELSGSGKVRCSAGRIILEEVTITDSLDLSASAGSINVELAGDPGLEYSLNSSAGSIKTYFGASTSGSDKRVSGTYGEAPYKTLTANTSAGSIVISD